MQKITPCLWFDTQVEDAANLYTSVFNGGSIEEILRLPTGAPGQAERVMLATFRLAGLQFMALNGGPDFSFTPSVSYFVQCQSRDELDALWQELSTRGTTLMPLNQYPFSEWYGWLADRYGVSWQLSLAGTPQKVTPFLMYVGEQNGKTEEAIRWYTSLFDNSRLNHLDRFGADEEGTEGAVKHASFQLAGQEFMAMDGGLGHNFTFTPASSFYIHCQNQDEVDFFWEKLSEGGEESQCGWLIDKFGISWQVIPDELTVLMNDPDPHKAASVTQAMLQMTKIDLAQLRQAYQQV